MTKGHCCATVALERISATVTCVMWREVHLWKFWVFRRVRPSSLVLSCVVLIRQTLRHDGDGQLSVQQIYIMRKAGVRKKRPACRKPPSDVL